MVSGYGRDVSSFDLLRYLEIRHVTKSMGFWLRMKSEQGARVRYNNLADMRWPDGAERPRGQDNLELFEFEKYQTERYAKSFTIGQRTLDQADWPLREFQTKQIAQQMMTGKTVAAQNFLATAPWGPSQANVDGNGGTLGGNAAILGNGQNWSNGTSLAPNIKISIEYATNIITLLTVGTLKLDDLAMVISPATAYAMSVSPEINDIMARSIYAMPNLTGELWFNRQYALPDVLYGMRLIVDRTVQITNDKLVTPAPLSAYQYVYPKGTAYVLTIEESRAITKEGKVGKIIPTVKKNNRSEADMAGGERDPSNYYPSLATLTGFFLEELTVESQSFPWDRLDSASIVSDFDLKLSSPKGGFQFQRVLG
jgi:hypothetical protein